MLINIIDFNFYIWYNFIKYIEKKGGKVMKKVYACLLGNWVCLNDDPECVFPDFGTTPSEWWEESAKIYAPVERTKEMKDSMYY